MPDEKKWRLALSQFHAIRSNAHGFIHEKLVIEFHEMLDLMTAASGEDLGSFRIPTTEIKPRIVSVQMGSRNRRGSTQMSKDNYCDSNLFKRKLESLSHYIPNVEEVFRNQPQKSPENTTDYWSMTTPDLEQLAIRYRIEGYGYSTHGGIDRQTIIDALLKRDRAIRAGNPVPHQTIHVEKMEHSVIQQGTHGSTATATHSVSEQKELLEQLKKLVAQLELNPDDRDEVETDIATMQIQLDSGKPRKPIMDACKISVGGILEKVIASGIAVPLVHEISRLLHYMQ
jgi:hypothetical protein